MQIPPNIKTDLRIALPRGAVTAWGNALLIATFGKWALIGFDAFVLLWLAIAACLIWAASRALTMLEAEEHDD